MVILTNLCEKIRRYFGNMGIAWKFTIAYFVILALPVILTGFYISYMTTVSINQQAELLVKQSLIQKRELINQKIQSIERTSIAITQNPKILEYLEGTFEHNLIGYENYVYFFAPLFDSYIIQNRYIHHTKLYVRNTSFPDAWNGIYHFNRIALDERYGEFLQTNTVLQQWNPIQDSTFDRQISTAINERVLSLSRKLISFLNGENIGVLEIEISTRTLFENLETDMGVVECYIVFDDMGQVVHENINRTLPDNLKADFIAVLNREEPPKGILLFQGERLVTWYLPLESIGGRIIGVAPLSAFALNNQHYRRMITFVLVTALLILGLIIYFVSNRLTRRLKLLVSGIKSVQDESINIKMPIDNNDEVGELSESFNQMTDRIHILIERVYKAQILEKESALKALEAQINPHFLYNTLSTLSWMARKINAEDIDNLVSVLAKFYRLVLSKGNSVISVGDEIALLKAYVEIEKIRFGDLFNVVYDLDEDAFQFKTIKIILQPIAENAIHHGIAAKDGKGTLVVRLRQDDKRIFFSIIDDGVGISRDVLESIEKNEIIRRSETGYAIQNVRERINAVYGSDGHLRISSHRGCGCAVDIVIPKTSMFLNLE